MLFRSLGNGYGQLERFIGPYGQLCRLLLALLLGCAMVAVVLRAFRRRQHEIADR